MNSLELNVGEHYQYCGSDYQVVAAQGNRYQLRSLKFSKQIVIQSYERLVSAWRNGTLVKTQEAPFAPRVDLIVDALNARQQNIMAKRLAYVLPVLERWGGRLPRQPVLTLLSEIAEQRGEARPSYGALYLWIRAYLSMGENKLALVPRTRSSPTRRVFRQPEVVQELIQLNLAQLFFKLTPCKKTDLISAIQCSINACNEKRPPHDQLACPSTSTLYRIITELDRYETDRHQLGYRRAIRRQKWSKKCRRPLELFNLVEGDTHELDVETVDKDGHLIGRLYLTALIEVRTRVITGWDISYNPPSTEKTMRALKHSLLSSNPYGGLARRYRLDNGSEFANARLKSVLQDLGGDVTYCEPGNPDQKPHIESFFKTWTTSIAHCMPGTTFSGPNPYDSEANATLTQEDVMKNFEDWIVTAYHPGFQDGLGKSPQEAWDEDQANTLAFEQKRYNEEDLNRHLLCVAYVKPNNGRLRFKGLAWTGPAVSYLATQHSGKPRSLRLLYDISELGKAWVCDPSSSSELFEVMAVDPDYQKGLTMHLHEMIKARLRARKQSPSYSAAREARVQILRELASAKTKTQRKIRKRAEERGDFNARPSLPAPSVALEDDSNRRYQFHPDTPSDYSSVVTKHDR
ncbi:integrase [Pseudomonas fluorescens NCIMB 11764]|uniref:Integrase n=1 Tax=Pseudomonas fluorescens NCIMB 11764 TaxID=1221522 RepID=A0A0K1QX71_PSEFL|nr:DDE-type integrase/transposase/recombinase [Pseudomonas fluorescens]AKV10085.1 integrase [Pseudomonas fluorescens NCIMB 11764]